MKNFIKEYWWILVGVLMILMYVGIIEYGLYIAWERGDTYVNRDRIYGQETHYLR